MGFETLEIACWPKSGGEARRYAGTTHIDVADLSPEYRAAFLLREFHDLGYADIAGVLAIDVGTVKSRLARARTALRAALAEVRDG